MKQPELYHGTDARMKKMTEELIPKQLDRILCVKVGGKCEELYGFSSNPVKFINM